MYEYDLFAVINHEGQMDNGHYTNFARFRDEVCFFFGRCFRADASIRSGIASTMTGARFIVGVTG